MMRRACTRKENTYVEEYRGCFTHDDDEPVDDAS